MKVRHGVSFVSLNSDLGTASVTAVPYAYLTGACYYRLSIYRGHLYTTILTEQQLQWYNFDQILYLRTTPHISPSWPSYGVSFVKSSKEILPWYIKVTQLYLHICQGKYFTYHSCKLTLPDRKVHKIQHMENNIRLLMNTICPCSPLCNKIIL